MNQTVFFIKHMCNTFLTSVLLKWRASTALFKIIAIVGNFRTNNRFFEAVSWFVDCALSLK